MVRVVVEIPKAFAKFCRDAGDRPSDVILDLIDEFMDETIAEALEAFPSVVDDLPTQAEPPPPPAMAGRGWPDIAEFLRERD